MFYINSKHGDLWDNINKAVNNIRDNIYWGDDP